MNNQHMAEKLESLLDDRDQVEVVKLNEQVRDFAKSEDGNGRKDTYNKHFFQRSIVEKLGYFTCSPSASTRGFLGKL